MDSSNNVVAINDQVASILGITPNVPSLVASDAPAPLPAITFMTPRPALPVRTDGATQIDNDSEFARDNLYDVIAKTNESIANLMIIATQAQSPRHYEVLNMLLNTQRETAAQLLKLQADRQKLAGKGAAVVGAPQGNVHIANAVFVGTNAQLLDLIHGKNRAEEATIRDAEFLTDDEE